MDAELARQAILHRSPPEDAAVQLTRYLTGREREVLVRLVRGGDTGVIADRMGVRPATARSHVRTCWPSSACTPGWKPSCWPAPRRGIGA